MAVSEPQMSRVSRPGRQRDLARGLVAERGLAPTAIEHLTRNPLGRLPVSLVERARNLLRRFFSAGPWAVEDDSSLAGVVGPGTGWDSHPLDDELTLEYGWRGGGFRVDLRYEPRPSAELPVGHSVITAGTGLDPPTAAAAPPSTPPTLGDTFDSGVVTEATPTPAQIRFLTGPGANGSGQWIRSAAETGDERTRSLFYSFADVTAVALGPGVVTVELREPARWHDLLQPLLSHVVAQFTAGHPDPPPDHQMERARADLRGLSPESKRDLAKIVDTLTSPDPAYRTVAVELVADADPFTAERAWATAVDDGSRGVRRAAVRGMAAVGRPEVRPLLERLLGDSDSYVRYWAVRGLAAIGAERSRGPLERVARDDDARVRLAVDAALSGRTPA